MANDFGFLPKDWLEVIKKFSGVPRGLSEAELHNIVVRLFGAEPMSPDMARQIVNHLRTYGIGYPPTETQIPKGNKLNQITEQLRTLRFESDMTVEGLAEGVGLQVRSVYRHLSGRVKIRKSNLEAYSKFFSKKLKRQVTF